MQEKKEFLAVRSTVHYINGSWLHARLPYARHFESQATVKKKIKKKIKKCTHILSCGVPHLPGTLEERQLTERSLLNPSHPCRLAACDRKNQKIKKNKKK